MKSAFYNRLDGARFQPLEPATGSWNRAHQNGVGVAGLLAQTIEDAPTRSPMRIVRFTLDIMRPVPFSPVDLQVSTVRDGARMQLVDARLLANGEVVAQASAMRLRMRPSPVAEESAPPCPDPLEAPPIPVTSVLGVGCPMETRVVSGSIREAGPGAFWTRFNADLVAGEPMGGLARAAMASDIAGGPSSIVERDRWSFANVDLSLYLTRRPVGEWVLIDAVTTSAGLGVGLVNSRLADQQGVFGRAHQTLFLSPIAATA